MLPPWGLARERVIRLLDGAQARVRPVRARCRGCGRTHVVLPAWCTPRRAHGTGVIAAAAGAALDGTGHRVIAARLGVPAATVRGWLRRLRAQAEPLRCHAMRQLAVFDPTRSRLARPGCRSGTPWPRWPPPCTPPGAVWAAGRISSGRCSAPWAWDSSSCPPPADDHLRRFRAPPCPQLLAGPAASLPLIIAAAAVPQPPTA